MYEPQILVLHFVCVNLQTNSVIYQASHQTLIILLADLLVCRRTVRNIPSNNFCILRFCFQLNYFSIFGFDFDTIVWLPQYIFNVLTLGEQDISHRFFNKIRLD